MATSKKLTKAQQHLVDWLNKGNVIRTSIVNDADYDMFAVDAHGNYYMGHVRNPATMDVLLRLGVITPETDKYGTKFVLTADYRREPVSGL